MADSKILTNIRDAQQALDESVRALGILSSRVPDTLADDVRQLRASVSSAVRQLELARLLVQDQERELVRLRCRSDC